MQGIKNGEDALDVIVIGVFELLFYGHVEDMFSELVKRVFRIISIGC